MCVYGHCHGLRRRFRWWQTLPHVRFCWHRQQTDLLHLHTGYTTSQRKSPIPSAEYPWQPVLLRSLLTSWPTTDLSLNLSAQLHFLPLPPFNDKAWDTTELCTNSSGVGHLSSSNHLAMWEGQSHPGLCREVTARVTTVRARAPSPHRGHPETTLVLRQTWCVPGTELPPPRRQRAGSTRRLWGPTLPASPQLRVQLNSHHIQINLYSDENTVWAP